MGWTYTQKPYNGMKKAMDELHTWQSENVKYTVLDSALLYFREYYAAVKIEEPGKPARVFAAASMLDYRPNDQLPFGYKSMDETVGPVIDNCPARILDLLTATDYEHAIAWRARCRENIARRAAVNKMKPGARFMFRESIYFLESKKPFLARKGSQFGRLYRFPKTVKTEINPIN